MGRVARVAIVAYLPTYSEIRAVMSIKLIPLHLIVKREGFNVRKRRRDIAWIVASIREHGQVDPIMLVRARDDTKRRIYHLVQGEGRLDALGVLQLPAARAIVLSSATTMQRQMVLNMVENKHDDVHFLDTANRIFDLHKRFGRSFAEIATETGYSYEHVTNANRVIEKVTIKVLDAAYTLDACPVGFLIKLAALDEQRQIVEWDRRYGVGALDKPPRRRISVAAIKRLVRDAPTECKPGLDYVLRAFGGS